MQQAKAVKTATLRGFNSLLRSPAFVGITAMIAVVAIIIALVSFQRTSHEAATRAEQTQAENVHQRETFCGFVSPISQLDVSIIAPSSPAGVQFKQVLQGFVDGSITAKTNLGCPPIPPADAPTLTTTSTTAPAHN